MPSSPLKPEKIQVCTPAKAIASREALLFQLRKTLPERAISRFLKKLGYCPEKYKTMYIKTTLGLASPRDTIKMFCLHCVGYLKENVTTCDCEECPLWKNRPYQKRKGAQSSVTEAPSNSISEKN